MTAVDVGTLCEYPDAEVWLGRPTRPAARAPHLPPATHAVALHYDGQTDIELWCSECVERVVYSLDDPETAGKVVACRSLAGS